jgi:hypothetical protein
VDVWAMAKARSGQRHPAEDKRGRICRGGRIESIIFVSIVVAIFVDNDRDNDGRSTTIRTMIATTITTMTGDRWTITGDENG